MEDDAPANKIAQVSPERAGFGQRLQAARKHAPRRDGGRGYTQDEVAERFSLNKATVSAWETGRGAPDAYTLGDLAKLYDVSADALLWEASLSPSAMKIAAEYDHLPPDKQSTWHVLWLGFITGAAPGGDALPAAPADESPDRTYEELVTRPRVGTKGSTKKSGTSGT